MPSAALSIQHSMQNGVQHQSPSCWSARGKRCWPANPDALAVVVEVGRADPIPDSRSDVAALTQRYLRINVRLARCPNSNAAAALRR